MVNAFDLVRIHRFGDQDTNPTIPTNRQPSYTAMTDLAMADPATKREAAAAVVTKMQEVFQPITPPGAEAQKVNTTTTLNDDTTVYLLSQDKIAPLLALL